MAGTVQEENQLISRLDFSYKKSSMAQNLRTRTRRQFKVIKSKKHNPKAENILKTQDAD